MDLCGTRSQERAVVDYPYTLPIGSGCQAGSKLANEPTVGRVEEIRIHAYLSLV
jgi:hypothetical protein